MPNGDNNNEFIEAITDLTLQHPRIRKYLSWKRWTIDCAKKTVPSKGSIKEIYWKRNRLIWKNLVNEEFINRKLTARLFVKRPGEGIHLIEDEKTITIMLEKLIKRVVRSHIQEQENLELLYEAVDDPRNQRLLQRFIGKSETSCHDFVGTITRMRLHPKIKHTALIEAGMIKEDDLK